MRLRCDACGGETFRYCPGGFLPTARHIYSCLGCNKQIYVSAKGSRHNKKGQVDLKPADRVRLNKRRR